MDTEDEEQLIRSHAIDLISEATGGNATYMERLSDADQIDEDRVVSLLREAGVPLAAILREDLNRLFSGAAPRYFISPHRIAELYRIHHVVRFSERGDDDDATRLDCIAEQMKQEQAEVAAYGVSLGEYRRGAACIAEQAFFYETEEWQDRAKVIRLIDHFTCRACGGRGRELHVHHDEHIYSACCQQFYRNFDSIRLRSLCAPCHRAFHDSHIRGYSNFLFAKPAERQEAREFRTKLTQLHDRLKECPFCFPAGSALPR